MIARLISSLICLLLCGAFTISSAQTPAMKTLVDKDGILITSLESKKALQISFRAPEPISIILYVDRNQNQKIDRLVDVSYGTTKDDAFCPVYLLDERSNTGCGGNYGFHTGGKMTKVRRELGYRTYTVEIPKKELSFKQPSASVYFEIWNSAQRIRSCFPSACSFQSSMTIPFEL